MLDKKLINEIIIFPLSIILSDKLGHDDTLLYALLIFQPQFFLSPDCFPCTYEPQLSHPT